MAFSLNQLSQKWTKYGQIGIGRQIYVIISLSKEGDTI